MPQDAADLMHVLHFFLIVAAVCATVFPLVYAFIPWYSTPVGRVLMLHGIALALALDLSVIYQYWRPTDIEVALWIDVVVFSVIAAANVALTVILLKAQFGKRKGDMTTVRDYDGTLDVSTMDDGKKMYSLNLDSHPDELDNKHEVIFKVNS